MFSLTCPTVLFSIWVATCFSLATTALARDFSNREPGDCDHSKAGYHLEIIFSVLEDILTIDSSKHDMIDARTAFCPFLSWHVPILSC